MIEKCEECGEIFDFTNKWTYYIDNIYIIYSNRLVPSYIDEIAEHALKLGLKFIVIDVYQPEHTNCQTCSKDSGLRFIKSNKAARKYYDLGLDIFLDYC